MHKQSFLVSLIVILLGAGFSQAYAQQEQWLQYYSSKKASEMIGGSPSPYHELSEAAHDSSKLPEFICDKPAFGKWKQSYDSNGPRIIAFDKSEGASNYDKVYFDTDGDGSLKDEKPLKFYSKNEYETHFGPVPVYFQGEDGLITYHIEIKLYTGRNQNYLRIDSACWYAGDVNVNGKAIKCTLIDYNANGRFDDIANEKTSICDRIWIGKTGNAYEAGHLGKYIRVGGKFYTVSAARDGANVKISPAENIIYRKVKVPKSITKLSVCGSNGYFDIEPIDGVCKVISGKYRVDKWSAQKTDNKKKKWSIQASNAGKIQLNAIEDNHEVLDLGEPLVSTVSVRKGGNDRFSFNQETVGRYGERIDISRTGMYRNAAPKLRIRTVDMSYDKKFSLEYG